VPERGGQHGALGDAALDPAIAKVVAGEKFSDVVGAGKKCAQAAGGALMKVAPSDGEFGLDDDGRGRRCRNRGHARGRGRAALSQKVEPTIDLTERHESFEYSVAGGQEVWIRVVARGMPGKRVSSEQCRGSLSNCIHVEGESCVALF